jgi:primosomal protein N''
MEEKRMLEFRLLQLKQAEEGKKDAKLQQQIEYTEGRLQKINYKLKKMEEKYA